MAHPEVWAAHTPHPLWWEGEGASLETQLIFYSPNQESFNIFLQPLSDGLLKLPLEDRFSCDCSRKGSQSGIGNQGKTVPIF